MELDGGLWWVVWVLSVAWTVFVIVVMVAVLRAAREALIFFRNANAAHRRRNPAPARPPVNPADTVWDDIP